MENYLVMNTTDHVMLMNRVEYDTILRHFVPSAVPTCDRMGDRTLLAWNRSLPEQFTMEYMTAHIEGRSKELLTATANLLKSGKYLASEIQTCLQKCATERLLAHKPVYAAIQDGSYVKKIQKALGKNPSVQH